MEKLHLVTQNHLGHSSNPDLGQGVCVCVCGGGGGGWSKFFKILRIADLSLTDNLSISNILSGVALLTRSTLNTWW